MILPTDNCWHFCCIHASEYRSIFWSETEQAYLQNCLFNFTAQLYLVWEDIMKLIFVRERSIILTDQAEMKNKIIQSDNFNCKCWLCQADITKMTTILPPSIFKIYSFKRTSGTYITRYRAMILEASPWKPRVPSPGVNGLAHPAVFVHGQSYMRNISQTKPLCDYQVFHFSFGSSYKAPTKHVFRWSRKWLASCHDRVTYSNDFLVQWSGPTVSIESLMAVADVIWIHWPPTGGEMPCYRSVIIHSEFKNTSVKSLLLPQIKLWK